VPPNLFLRFFLPPPPSLPLDIFFSFPPPGMRVHSRTGALYTFPSNVQERLFHAPEAPLSSQRQLCFAFVLSAWVFLLTILCVFFSFSGAYRPVVPDVVLLTAGSHKALCFSMISRVRQDWYTPQQSFRSFSIPRQRHIARLGRNGFSFPSDGQDSSRHTSSRASRFIFICRVLLLPPSSVLPFGEFTTPPPSRRRSCRKSPPRNLLKVGRVPPPILRPPSSFAGLPLHHRARFTAQPRNSVES